MRRRVIGEDEMQLKFLGEVTLEEESRYIVLDGIKCTRVMVHLVRPTALTNTTTYGFFGFRVNGIGVGSNINMYETDSDVNCYAEMEALEGAVFAGAACMRGRTGAPSWTYKISDVEIEKINKVEIMHAAGNGLLPVGTTMKVWGY